MHEITGINLPKSVQEPVFWKVYTPTHIYVCVCVKKTEISGYIPWSLVKRVAIIKMSVLS